MEWTKISIRNIVQLKSGGEWGYGHSTYAASVANYCITTAEPPMLSTPLVYH